MNGIQIKNNRILYYGNTAGYIDKAGPLSTRVSE
jgi:hypothetical protein